MGLVHFIRIAAAEIWRKLLSGGWRLPALGSVPALLCVGVLYWMAEAYVAAMGLRVSQILTLVAGALVCVALSAIALGRALQFLLRPARRPKLHRALEIGPVEARSMLAFALFGVLALGVALVSFAIETITASAFFIAGSEAIESTVKVTAHAVILATALYILGRLSPIVSAAALGEPGLSGVWAATDEDAGALLALIWGLPLLVFCLVSAPILYALGILPLPGLADAEGAARMLSGLRGTGWFAALVVFMALIAAWSVMAVCLALAHERLLPVGRGIPAGGLPSYE